LKTFVSYRNSLAHFEVYHVSDHAGLAAEPPTKYNVLLSENHMNAPKRTARVNALSIEQIELNSESTREEAYKLIYFIVDHFPLAAFIGKGLLPITERQLEGFYSGPRLPEFPPPDSVASARPVAQPQDHVAIALSLGRAWP
jgi:hypothetical protein